MRVSWSVFVASLVWYVSSVHAISNKKLLELSKRDGGVIDLNSKNYEKILNSPRKSDIVVFFTATSTQFACTLCLEMGPSVNVVANSWFADHSTGISNELDGHGLFFARADFTPDTKKLFAAFGLNSVPAFYVFKAGGDSIDQYERLTITTELGGNHLGFIAGDVGRVTGIPDLVVYEPVNWGATITIAVVTGIITYLVKNYYSTIARVIMLRPLWGVLCSFVVITLISGTMFVKIRNPQLSGVSQDRTSIIYFMTGQLQNQYAIESQIVTVMYSMLASSFIGLICVVPGLQKWYRKKNQRDRAAFLNFAFALFFAGSIYVIYSALLAVFQLKNTGYPFRLLKNPFK